MRELPAADLQGKISEWEGNMFRFRCQKKVGQLEKISDISNTRRDIARAKTILSEKKHAGK